jgi:hypothetical protein
MNSAKKHKIVKSFPWKAVFGAITILGVMVLLSSPNDPKFIKGKLSPETSQNGLSGFSLKK